MRLCQLIATRKLGKLIYFARALERHSKRPLLKNGERYGKLVNEKGKRQNSTKP